jgi:ABC-type phosphate/phosphonate transport system substrate-binding protein
MMRTTSAYLVGCIAIIAINTGCQTTAQRFLRLIGLEQEPVAVALVMDQRPESALEAWNPFPRYAALQKALSGALGRPVGVDVCFPFQVESGFDTGWYDLAILTPEQYAVLKDPAAVRPLAIPIDRDGESLRPALLVVRNDSDIQQVEDLRGKVVAFGRVGDPRAHLAALTLLREHGINREDLALEVLPLPGSLKHMPSMRGVAQTVANQSSAAGFVDAAAWDAWPEHDDNPDAIARDRFRVIAETIAVPMRVLVARGAFDEATSLSIQDFLLDVAKTHPEVLEPLGISGYEAPTPDALNACRELTPMARSLDRAKAAPPE